METQWSRRDFLKAGAAGALGAALKPSVGRADGGETLRVGYLPITDAAPLLIAHAKGYFQQEGLKMGKPVRVRSWSTLAESFLSGKFNVTHLLLPIPLWMRFKNKAPVKILAWNHTNGSAVTVRGDSRVEGFKDLGGRQIAVPHWYSIHNIILQMGLRKFGLKPVIQPQSAPLKSNEVNLFMLSPSEMPAALFGKKIDGYIVAEPFNAIGEMKIRAKIMRFTGDIWKNHPCCVVVMHENTIRSRPAFTQKVVNAIVRAQLWIIGAPGRTARILSREGEGYLPVAENILRKVFTGYDVSTYGEGASPRAIKHADWDVGRIGFQPYPYPSATRLITREMRRTLMEGDGSFLKSLQPDFAARDLVEDRFVKKAIDAVGGPGKFSAIHVDHPWKREEIVQL